MNLHSLDRRFLLLVCFLALGASLISITGGASKESVAPEAVEAANRRRIQDDLHSIYSQELKPGLSLNTEKASPGFTLIEPMAGKKTYLIDLNGKIVHEWKHDDRSSYFAKILTNGHLLRCSLGKKEAPKDIDEVGVPGHFQELDWNGDLLWDFILPNPRLMQHHDFTILPNGNILAIARERVDPAVATANGWKESLKGEVSFPNDCLLEIKKTGKYTGEIVWRWNVLDHVLQDIDPKKANYVEPSHVRDHPELINLNYKIPIRKSVAELNAEMSMLRSIGYVGAEMQPTTSPADSAAEWTHFNSVDYNVGFDQIMISVREFSEIWIIDHSTTTEQAAGRVGGKCSKGGDILYRWGNPAAYRRGALEDQVLFGQHGAHWIPEGLPGAGRLLVFNNGDNRPGGCFSSIEEAVLPADQSGNYPKPDGAFGPTRPIWTYVAQNKSDFFSRRISGVQRLPNGNTLVCSGVHGLIFETNLQGELAWRYLNRFSGTPSDDQLNSAKTSSGQAQHVGPNPAAGVQFRIALFKAHRYPLDFPGFAGKKLDVIESREVE